MNLNIVKISHCWAFICLTLLLQAQPLTQISLEEAIRLYENRYPSLKDSSLLHEIYNKEESLIDLTKLPLVNLNSEVRLQSETIGFNTEGIPSPLDINIPLYSAKAYLESQYQLFDGGLKNAQKQILHSKLQEDLQYIELEKYQLKGQIIDLCTRIQWLREQQKLLDISIENIDTRQNVLKALVEQGVILESELSQLKVKEMQLQAALQDLKYKHNGLIMVLRELTGTALSYTVTIKLPEFSQAALIPSLQRPELALFQLKSETLQANTAIIDAKNDPKLTAFLQTGLGYPDPLNFFDTELSPFAVVGLQLHWPLIDWKKAEREKEIVKLKTRKIQHARESFEFQQNAVIPKFLAEINRLENQIKNDEQIADLQRDLLNVKSAQLDQGIITSSDFLIQFNEELKARQNLAIHQTELLITQLEFWNFRGAL